MEIYTTKEKVRYNRARPYQVSDKIEKLGEQYGMNCPYGIDKIRPRYKKDKTTKKIHETITPKFKQLVNDSPEMKRKLEDYLAPDVWYYAKAK